jgi:anti-sigma-K factor RskA
MTEEQRLDRLERIVKLMIKAGLRARRQSREQDDKINILIGMHMKNEERYEKRFTENEEKLAALAAKTEEKFAELAESQKSLANTVERIMAERGNGKP